MAQVAPAAAAELLPCQRDSYLRTLQATVRSCREAKAALGSGGSGGKKKDKSKSKAPVQALFEVVLDQTCLYPEGGGQPSDRGTIGDFETTANVVDVLTAPDGSVVHTVDQRFDEGEQVTVSIDWERRYDLMQQHTAQHALSGYAERRFGLETVSWELGREVVCVDFKPSTEGVEGDLNGDTVAQLAGWVNEAIRSAPRIKAHALTAATPPEDYPAAMRGLDEAPDFGARPVLRLVEIEGGVDFGPCGGTHVANLAECQAFAVLSLERNRGAARVVFLAGGRAVARLGAALGREAALGKAFSCAPDELVARTEQALAARRDAVKESKALQAELAEALGAALGTSAAADMLKCASCHRTAPATPPFLGAIFAAAQDVCKDATVLLTASNGPDAKDGMVLLAGPADAVALAAPEVARCVDARGGGKKGRWQGRAAKLTAQAVAEAQEAMRRALASAE